MNDVNLPKVNVEKLREIEDIKNKIYAGIPSGVELTNVIIALNEVTNFYVKILMNKLENSND